MSAQVQGEKPSVYPTVVRCHMGFCVIEKKKVGGHEWASHMRRSIRLVLRQSHTYDVTML